MEGSGKVWIFQRNNCDLSQTSSQDIVRISLEFELEEEI